MYDPTVGRFLEEDPLGFRAGDANLGRYVGNRSLQSTDPTGMLTKEQHKVFQGIVTKTAEEIQANKRSSCGGFAYLMGKLFDMNLVDYNQGLIAALDPTFSRRHALRQTISDALWYFADPAFAYNGMPGDTAKASKDAMTRIAGEFTTPRELRGHHLGGRQEGYIQLPDDPDSTGRHDHFLVNAFWSRLGIVGAMATKAGEIAMGENSETDKRVNAIGRQFGIMASDNGAGFANGKDLAEWILKNLCDESICGCRFKGVNWDGIPDTK